MVERHLLPMRKKELFDRIVLGYFDGISHNHQTISTFKSDLEFAFGLNDLDNPKKGLLFALVYDKDKHPEDIYADYQKFYVLLL